MKSSLAKRLVTSAIGIPAAMAVVFLAPGDLAFAVFFLAVFWAAAEFVRLARPFAPSAPVGSLLLLMPAAALSGFAALRGGVTGDLGMWLAAATSGIALAAAFVPLVASTEPRDGLVAFGILAFATPYFAVPPAMLYHLQTLDPWLLFVLLAMVWIGDTAAFWVGSSIGRHKLAPRVSPNKTWEGAVASFAAGMAVAVVWSLIRLGELRPAWLAVAAATCVAAQLGDLVESHVKRGAGVKDSSDVLPGHGGFFDRLDALLTAAPVFTLGAWWLGFASLSPG